MVSPSSVVKRRNREASIFIAGLLVGLFASFSLSLSILTTKSLESSTIPLTLTSTSPLYGVNVPNEEVSSTIQGTNFRRANSIEQPAQDSGWKTIHVFFGNQAHLADTTTLPTPYFQANQWFSQFRQDEIISRLFRNKRKGYFIDLAANDAVRISNTYALETSYGWSGLCLEPNSIYWSGLAYRKCDVVAAVIGGETMEEIEFQFPKDKAPKGGIVGKDFDNKEVKKGETQRRYTVNLLEVFRRFQVPKVIDYLSLDVEGAEDLVMSKFPFSEYRFHTLTVERPSTKLEDLLTKNGYVLLKTLKDRTETLWAHSSISDQLDMAALRIDSASYKYRENSDSARVAPESIVA
jgi:hypothetical protein